LLGWLRPLALRLDLSDQAREEGEPGDPQPGAASLFQPPEEYREQTATRSTLLEARVQINAWARWIERWETTRDRVIQAPLARTDRTRALESRLELRPRGGRITLRWRFEEPREEGSDAPNTRRLQGDWDQTWGGGWLSYLALLRRRAETRDRLVGERTTTWNPQARVTLRRTWLHLDASLGAAYQWSRWEDRSAGARLPARTAETITLSAACSLQPVRILTLHVQVGVNRARETADTDWTSGQDLRLRLSVRV